MPNACPPGAATTGTAHPISETATRLHRTPGRRTSDRYRRADTTRTSADRPPRARSPTGCIPPPRGPDRESRARNFPARSCCGRTWKCSRAPSTARHRRPASRGSWHLSLPCLGLTRSCGCSACVEDARQHADRHLAQPLRAVRDVTAKGQGVALLEQIALLAVAVTHLPRQNVDELGPRVLKAREDLALVGECDEERLEFLARPTRSGQQLIGMSAPGAAPPPPPALSPQRLV